MCVHIGHIGLYAPPILKPAEHIFGLMSLFIRGFVIINLDFSVLIGGNAGYNFLIQQAFSEPVRIMAPIRQKVFGGRKFIQ